MDTWLPIGANSSPGIFNYLPDAVKWVIEKVYEARHLCFLLDDFISVESRSGGD